MLDQAVATIECLFAVWLLAIAIGLLNFDGVGKVRRDLSQCIVR